MINISIPYLILINVIAFLMYGIYKEKALYEEDEDEEMLCFAMILSTASCKNESVETLTYAVFPYLSDTDYYQQLIESRWAELEPEIQLIRNDWDCYS